jgi:hypothetical protein
LTKEEALKRGYRWRDRDKKANEYQITIQAKNLPDNLENVPDSITKEIIGCMNKDKFDNNCCRGAYRIIEDELNLYKRLGVPLPRLCFYCRHESRLRKRNPMKLWGIDNACAA